MAVTTFSAALTITPVVIKTFFRHWTKKIRRVKDGEDKPQDDIFFDQAFHIVKSFIAFGSENTIESLQAFTNTRIPAPPWAAVSPVLIPLKTCNEAADRLIEWFGPEELEKVVGGDRWWQVRGLDGVDAEWVAEYGDLAPDRDEFHKKDGKKLKDADADILRMEKLEPVMLYVHGGGYFWGSINTHRYQILHFTHKFRGRAFAVNYRKAPQYPWPCPIQDVLAAYLYLIQPPPEALHKPILPSKIVFAGDSAGGGLCVTALTILRDLGIPPPAGAVLISPWVDLTHSFPSVMANYHTDIIPKHGFLAKPSTLWPNPTIPESGSRLMPTITNPPPPPGKADTLKPSLDRLQGKTYEGEVETGEIVKVQQTMLDDYAGADIIQEIFPLDEEESKHGGRWEPKPPKVLMENSNAVPLELKSQIQMYAPTELLTHPLVSPVLQSSLGNLPPLYIIAGDGEVLRDEITYLAHKAANPAAFPTRPGILRDCRRQKENAEKFTTPTKVHLQVFDGMCHVFTVFMFTKSAKYAYRSMGVFIKHVTQHDSEHVERNPFPESRYRETPEDDKYLQKKSGKNWKKSKGKQAHRSHAQKVEKEEHIKMHGSLQSRAQVFSESKEIHAQVVKEAVAGSTDTNIHEPAVTLIEDEHPTESKQSLEKGNDTPAVGFLRERVDIRGVVRPMESPDDVPALKLQPLQIGLIKEGPTLRWHDGQKIWDKRYRRDTQRVLKQRTKCEARAARLLKGAFDQGFVHNDANVNRQASEIGAARPGDSSAEHDPASTSTRPSRKLKRPSSLGTIQADRRWGPLDLYGEHPPATAIAGRRDTPEAVALLKKSIYHTAPRTHKTVPRLKAIDVVAASLDPKDDPKRPPRQSVSEQQVQAKISPVHGLRVWDGLLRYFGRQTIKAGIKAENIGSSRNNGGDCGADNIEKSV